MIDLRRTFDKYKIPWKDRGPNCSRGHVNISCPFCKTDPSYHLSIAEDGSAYYCFRNPEHAGRKLSAVFFNLKIPKKELEGLERITGVAITDVSIRPISLFNTEIFSPAIESDEAIDYLSFRKFSAPTTVCTMFGLLTQPEGGRWVGRLIIPLTVGWTSRSMRPHIEPRYLANTTDSGFFAYSNNNSSVVVVEGAIDAMRIAACTGTFDVVAKCGNRLSPALLNYLVSKDYISIYNVPDSDIPVFRALKETHLLDYYCFDKFAKMLQLPTGIKDCGEMEDDMCREWLTHSDHFRYPSDSFKEFIKTV